MPRPTTLATHANYAPWEAYQRPYVRDLAYVLACPNVLTKWLDVAPYQNTHAIFVHSASFWQQQFEAYQQRLKELDTTNDYQALTRYLTPVRDKPHCNSLILFTMWLPVPAEACF